jgi:membrane protein YdbS with pleckstrin-like domain
MHVMFSFAGSYVLSVKRLSPCLICLLLLLVIYIVLWLWYFGVLVPFKALVIFLFLIVLVLYGFCLIPSLLDYTNTTLV